MNHSLLRLTVISAFVFSLSGCAVFQSLFRGGGSANTARDARPEYDAAIVAKDVAKMKALCADESLGNPEDHGVPANAPKHVQSNIQSNRQVRRDACFYARSAEADVDDGNCATVADRWKNATMQQDGDRNEFYLRWARRLSKCDAWATVFEEIARMDDFGTNAVGYQVLRKLDADGVNVRGGFGRYLASHTGRRFLAVKQGNYAMNHIANWLLKAGHKDQCGRLARALKGAADDTVRSALFYFSQTGCQAEGEPLALALLTSESARARAGACANLGTLVRTRRGLKKVKILAKSDTYSEVVERRRGGRVWAERVYPVRDACVAAAGKIQLRL